MVASAFHFVNRIADLLHVDSEGLPESLRRFETVRRLAVRALGAGMARMDLANRDYGKSYETALTEMEPVFTRALGQAPGGHFECVRERPKLIEVVRLALEERDERSTLDRATLCMVHGAVEEALPSCAEDSQGFHVRPADPVEAFAFVGTRYASRTTEKMIEALREAGYDDIGVLDLATAIADANLWARLHRLLGLAPEIFRLETLSAAEAVA